VPLPQDTIIVQTDWQFISSKKWRQKQRKCQGQCSNEGQHMCKLLWPQPQNDGRGRVQMAGRWRCGLPWHHTRRCI